jgi:AraC family transcriptional activator of pobA
MVHSSKQEVSKLDLPIGISTEISIFKDQQIYDNLENGYRFATKDDRSKMIVLIEGTLNFMLDFEEIQLTGPAILFISPEQACKILDILQGSQLYTLSYSAALVVALLENLTNETFSDNSILKNSPVLCQQVQSACELMYSIGNNNNSIFAMQSLHGLLLTLMSLIAGASQIDIEHASPAKNLLSVAFRRLVRTNLKKWKKPADYADELGISVDYLNACMKSSTGKPASNLIQNQIIIETKRLLFFSELTVKEICYEIGFEDPVYFNRLFKKLTGLTPLSFRMAFRDRYHQYLHPFYQCTRKATLSHNLPTDLTM